MTLGQLALHMAQVPGGIAKISQPDEFDASQANFGAKQPESTGEIFAAHGGTGFGQGPIVLEAGRFSRRKAFGKSATFPPGLEL